MRTHDKGFWQVLGNVSMLHAYEATVYVVALIMAEPSVTSLLLGCCISLPGLALRVWTRGYETDDGGASVYGPYRFVRHPHHLGTYLVLLGLCIASRSSWVTGLMMAGSLFLFREIFREEEAQSGGHKGVLYQDYKLRVPTFIPNLLPYTGQLVQNKSFSLGISMLKSHRRELDTLAALVLVYVLMFGFMRMAEPFYWQLGLGSLVIIYSLLSVLMQRRA